MLICFGSTPSLASFSRNAGSLSASCVTSCSLSTMLRGVLAGADSPFQKRKTAFGYPASNWQLGRLRTVEDLPHIDAGLAKAVRYIGPVTRQSADFDIVASAVGRWNPISCRQGDELNAAAVEEGVGA